MNIRCCFAIGPQKSLASPSDLPVTRMYAVITASTAANQPNAATPPSA